MYKHDFILNNKEYCMFYHPYNYTWENERCVEIPIVLQYINSLITKETNVLEVGNVFSWYFNWKHDIVDKYDTRDFVIKQDIVDYNPTKKYNIIFSVSTLEHVGYDELDRDSSKITRAYEHMQSLLSSVGSMIITLPLGYGNVTEILKNNTLKFTKEYFIHRESLYNDWKQIDKEKALNINYGTPYPCANCICIGIYSKE